KLKWGEDKFVLGVQNMLNPNSFGPELIALIKKYQQTT
ncbi:PTS system ascorbate-specific transporter subunits IICB, partial [Pasteurella multocida subsp. multocida str. Anand1_cattle]